MPDSMPSNSLADPAGWRSVPAIPRPTRTWWPRWCARCWPRCAATLHPKEVSLLSEVEALGRTISTAKAEIAALRVDDINASHIPFATDELDAIVAHTASATNAILESCETLDEVGAAVSGEVAAKLTGATTRIYEACSFQDITGQRITKVVGHAEDDRGRRWRASSPRSATCRHGRRRAAGSSAAAIGDDLAAEWPATADRRDGPVGHRPAAGELRLSGHPTCYRVGYVDAR